MKVKNILVIAAMVAAVGMVSSVNGAVIEMTTNGDFETGDYSGWTQFPSGPGQQSIDGVNPSSGAWANKTYNDVEASNSLMKQANLYAGFLTPGQAITVSFDMRGSMGVGGVFFAEVFSEVDGGGVSKAEILSGGPIWPDADPDVWTTYSYNTTLGPDVSGGMTLQLGVANGAVAGATSTVWFDNVSVIGDVIPEPATLGLLGLASAGLYIRRRFVI